MARRMKHDEQVDPFTAGEPTLPWEDPEPLHEEADCELAGEPYESPTKARDNYDAPSNDDTSVRELLNGLLSSGNTNAGGGTSRARKRPSKQSRATRAGGSTASSTAPKRTVRRVLKWVVLGTLAINLIPLFMGLVAFVFDEVLPSAFEPEYEPTEYPLADQGDSSEPDSDQLAEQSLVETSNRAIEAALASGGVGHEAVAQSLDSSLQASLGYSAHDLGLDTSAYADWLTSNVTWEVTSAYAFDDGTGSVYFDVWGPLSFYVEHDAADQLYSHLAELGVMEQGAWRELTADEQTGLREAFQSILDATPTNENVFCHIEFTRIDGEWTLDQEVFDEELAFALGTY